MSERWTRRLMAAALVLALVVVAASSALRLAGNGLSCDPWPECYGTPAATEQANASGGVKALRLSHRVAANAFLVVALVLVAGAWRGWRREQRGAGVALLVVTLLLAAVGLRTPSPLPWITWANVAGGFALVALLTRMLDRPAPASPAAASIGPAALLSSLLLALLLVQLLGGALLSARLAGADCVPGCAHPGGDLLALFDPTRAGPALQVGGNPGAGVALHALHRIVGLVLAFAALGVAAVQALRGGAFRFVAIAAAAALALGFVLAHLASPVAGAAHAVAAALLGAGLARWVPRAGTSAA